MPFYERGEVRIHYEEAGSGFPLLVIPGGGLNSTVAGLATRPFNPFDEFKGEFRVIAADLRNAKGGIHRRDKLYKKSFIRLIKQVAYHIHRHGSGDNTGSEANDSPFSHVVVASCCCPVGGRKPDAHRKAACFRESNRQRRRNQSAIPLQALRTRLVAVGRERAATFTWKATAMRTAEVLHEAAAEGRR